MLSNLATVVRDARCPGSMLSTGTVVRRAPPCGDAARTHRSTDAANSQGPLAVPARPCSWTAFGTLTFPALIWLVSYACRKAPTGPGRLTEEVGYALSFAIAPAFALAFLRVMMLEQRTAHAHFRWPRPRREALRNATAWLAGCVLPVQFILTLLVSRGDASPIDTLGRLLLALALVGRRHRLASARARPRVDQCAARDLGRAGATASVHAYRVLAANGAILAALVLRGYFVTGMTLSERDLASLGALLAIATAYGLAVRWLVLGERRLALQRMQTRKAADVQREDVTRRSIARGRARGDHAWQRRRARTRKHSAGADRDCRAHRDHARGSGPTSCRRQVRWTRSRSGGTERDPARRHGSGSPRSR